MAKVAVIWQITVTRDHKFVINGREWVLVTQDNMQPHKDEKNVSVLPTAGIAIHNKFCGTGLHLRYASKQDPTWWNPLEAIPSCHMCIHPCSVEQS